MLSLRKVVQHAGSSRPWRATATAMGPSCRWPSLVLLIALIAGSCATAPPRPLLSAQEHNDLGVAYQARGELELAVREYRRALAQDPDLVRTWLNLGNANLDLGRPDEALAAYERAFQLAPADPEVLNNLAWALHDQPQSLDRAERLIRQALAQNPTPRHFYLDTLGVILIKKGAIGEASDVLLAGLSLAPPGRPAAEPPSCTTWGSSDLPRGTLGQPPRSSEKPSPWIRPVPSGPSPARPWNPLPTNDFFGAVL